MKEEKDIQTPEEKVEEVVEKELSRKEKKQAAKAANAAEAAKAVEEELKAKLADSEDKYIRLAAEFDNYRRRTSKERLELIKTAGEDIIKGLLGTLDDYERALNSIQGEHEGDQLKEGMELIYNKLKSYLKSQGLEVMDCLGLELDTDFHEAIAQFPVEEAEKKNKIIDVVQQGYTLNEKVIRFAKVVVGV